MKIFASALVALLAGYMLGAWPLQSEVAKLKNEIRDLNATRAESAPRKPALGGIGRMLNVRAEPTDDFDDIPDPTLEPQPNEWDGVTQEVAVAEERQPGRGSDAFEQHIEKAVELWRVRSDLARGAFLSQIHASEEDTLRFDVVMEAMNVRLASTIQSWADILAGETMSQQEAGIRMMNEITEALTITYDELDRTMADGWQSHVAETFELTDFIDPSVALPLADVEDKLDFN